MRNASATDIHHLNIIVGVGLKINEPRVRSHGEELFVLEKAVAFNFVGALGKIDFVARERHFFVEVELLFRCDLLKLLHDCRIHIMSFHCDCSDRLHPGFIDRHKHHLHQKA